MAAVILEWQTGLTDQSVGQQAMLYRKRSKQRIPSRNVTLISRGLPRNVLRFESLNFFYCISDNSRTRTKRNMSTNRQKWTI